MSLTPAQKKAVAARGNVLVIAGAGTGKTSTLVARCLDCLLTEKISLQEILMVTFTEAAAAEMRRRIRENLEAELKDRPHDFHWHAQLALFDTAHIGTLHSFCLQLVRQHFYELQIDPQLAVLPEEEARFLAEETLEAVLQNCYSGRSELSEAVQQLIQTQNRGWDKPIRTLVFKLHNYTQTLANPSKWFADQLAMFDSPEPERWRQWLLEAIVHWCSCWLPILQSFAGENPKAGECLNALRNISKESSRAEMAAALEQVCGCLASDNFPRGKKTLWLKPLEKFLEEAEFLFTLAQIKEGKDPLAEDWNWSRSQMITLLRLTEEFRAAFAAAKREQGALDFHDLEQFALQLLWDTQNSRPTAIAREWRERLKFIFVDEYQDINAAQDKIIEALSGENAAANRFLVGDVKQSIYRFRLANPYIFQHYAATWRGQIGETIPLTENFRSREGVLDFINSVFVFLMRPEISSVVYDDQAKLQFGAPEERKTLSRVANSEPRVELHLRVKTEEAADSDDENSEAQLNIADLEEADKEARLVALRLRELKNQQHQIWDDKEKSFRAAKWSDMAILLRSPARKAESYAKEFSRLGVPLVVARGGFYESLEISDLLSLLQLLDNPLQDVPALAVLHSPLVGLSLNELAAIRLTNKGPFWMALQQWWENEKSKIQNPKSKVSDNETFSKVDAFLERFARSRRLTRQVSLSRCLETMLAETNYPEWLLTQSRGEQRRANVQRLLSLTQQFDQFQRQGLFRFLRFIDAQKAAETEPEVAAIAEEEAVRLMSIHQSKGLEFPIVVLADMGKQFNASDLRAEIILDEEFGLCSQIKPPHTGKRYPGLPYWLARRRQKQEMLGEELRLLYVAMTRARDTLILTATVSEKRFNARWLEKPEVNGTTLLSARNYADWLGLWFAQNSGTNNLEARSGETLLWRWFICDDTKLGLNEIAGDIKKTLLTTDADEATWNKLRERVQWQYSFAETALKPAKATVSSLRRQAAESADEEAVKLFKPKAQSPKPKVLRAAKARQAAADLGTAHHKFLQFISLERLNGIETLRDEAKRLVRENILLSEEIALLNFEMLADFWQSGFGQKILMQLRHVRRELDFTARFSTQEVAEITGETLTADLKDEFIVVQGTADLVVLLREEIWLLDFKTDDVRRGDLAARVKIYTPQLRLYAEALRKIYGKTVTECRLHFLSLGETVTIELTAVSP